MTTPATPLIVFVPGLRGFVAEHWQTLEAVDIPQAQTVPPLDVNGMNCAARIENLERTLEPIKAPMILVAHSAGCLIVAHWAVRTKPSHILGAVLATPADLETPLPEGYPDFKTLSDNGWLPVPRQKMPFPVILAASRNDPLCRFDRAQSMASDWGATIEDLGEVGHLNPASGFGPWPLVHGLIGRLIKL